MATIATQIHAPFDRFPFIAASSHIVPYVGSIGLSSSRSAADEMEESGESGESGGVRE